MRDSLRTKLCTISGSDVRRDGRGDPAVEARDDGEEGVGEGAGAGAAGAHRGGGGAQGRRHARVEEAFTPEEGHGGKGGPKEVGNIETMWSNWILPQKWREGRNAAFHNS